MDPRFAPESRPYPFSEPNLLEPDPLYAQLRRERRPTRVRLAAGGGSGSDGKGSDGKGSDGNDSHGAATAEAWLCSSYADVRRILTDPRFSLTAACPRSESRSPLNRVANAALKPRQIEYLRPLAERCADTLLDGLPQGEPRADLLAAFVKPLAATVVCDLLRVPDGDRDLFRGRLLSAADPAPAPERTRQARQDTKNLARYFAGLVASRSEDPHDDLVSTMIQARGEGLGRLNDAELAKIAARLVLPGFQNAVLVLANLIRVLIYFPAELARLRDRPELVPHAVEELIRYTPFHSTSSFPRYAAEDVEIGGAIIREGETVIGALCAANRDEEVFSAPDELDLQRADNAHVSFGLGMHYCPGAYLARIQFQVGISALVRRLEGLSAAPDDGAAEGRGRVLGWHDELPVVWSATLDEAPLSAAAASHTGASDAHNNPMTRCLAMSFPLP